MRDAIGSRKSGWMQYMGGLVVAIAALAFSLPASAVETVDLVILHINDTHGTFCATADSTKRGRKIGSMPRLGAMVRAIQRQEDGRVLTLHAGDLFSKAEPVTVHTGGAVSLDILQALDVDAFVPGNGEFYFGLKNLLAQTERVSVPVVLANIKLRKDKQPLFPSHVVVERKGVRIGIVGLGFCRMGHYASKPLLLEDAIRSGQQQAELLRDDVDLLIALTHIGHGRDRQLAARVPAFDIIIGGHSHTVTKTPVRIPRAEGNGEVVVVQAGEYWRNLGRLDVRMEKAAGQFGPASITGSMIPVSDTVEPDPELVGRLAKANQPLAEVIAADQPIRDIAATRRLVAKSIRQGADADIVVLDEGVAQAELPGDTITMADVYRVHPWRNEVLAADVSGGELAEVLPGILACKRVTVTGVTTGTVAGVDGSFLVDDEAVDPARRYTVAFGEFTATQCRPLTTLNGESTGQRIDTLLLESLRHNRD